MAVISLTLFGLVMVYSASSPVAYQSYGAADYLFIKQLIAALIGLTLLGLLTRLDYHRLARLDERLLLGALGLTLLTFVPGIALRHQWLHLGPLTLQPTELLKFALIVYLASSLAQRPPQQNAGFGETALPYLIVAGLAGLLALAQSDLGMAAIYGAITLFMLFVGGVRLRYFLTPALAALPLLAGLILSSGYRRDRIVASLHPFKYSQGAGYHLIQSLTALGSGGLLGRGLGAGHQKWLYLPEAYNDFIFAVIGEELGLLGALALIGLFGYLSYKGVQVALRAPDRLGQLLAGGMTFALACQAGINLGVAVGALPITGLTLPLVSYGGSSLIVSLAMCGVLLNVSRYSQAERRPDSIDSRNGRSRLFVGVGAARRRVWR